MNLYANFTFNDLSYIPELTKKEIRLRKLQCPIVYDDRYNIKGFGFEKLHLFDCQKYKKIFNLLLDKKVIMDDTPIHRPRHISRGLLLLV